MEVAINTIHHGDCIKLMSQMPAGTVDLAFADPPFNIGYEYDVYDDRKEHEHYLDWSRRSPFDRCATQRSATSPAKLHTRNLAGATTGTANSAVWS